MTSKNSSFVSLKFSKLKKYWQEVALTFFAIFYFIYFTAASFLRYENFFTGRFDLGNMAQTVWNTAHGNIFRLTDPNGVEEISRLSIHSDFILILLSPLYLIWEDPRTLLLVQTLILTFGGVFVFLISRSVLKNKTISLVFALCFYLNPLVNWTNLYDFHAVTLATTFLLAAFYFILRKNWILTVIFLILAGFSKEQVWIINALFGLYLIFFQKQKFLGFFIFTISFFIFYILFWVAIPNAAQGQHFALSFLSEYGGTPHEVIKSIILNPLMVINTVFAPDRVEYLRQLFLPLGFLSFIAFPFLVFSTPDLSINLLSGFSPMHQIYYQYSATITPFIFISAIYAVYFIRKFVPDVPIHLFSVLILITTLVSAYNFGPTLLAKDPNDAMFRNQLTIRGGVQKYIDSVPPDLKISSSNNLGAHLSHRRYIYVLPEGINEADKILILMRPSSNQKEKDVLNFLLENRQFELEYSLENFYVFKRII